MISVEDWAEIRRLHRAEGLPIKQIARMMNVSRNTVRAALRSEGPPKYEREPAGSVADGFEPRIRELLILKRYRLVQYAGRILRPHDGKTTAEVHDYHDELTGVLASSLAKRAPGYTSLGFPDPRKRPYTPSTDTTHYRD